MILKKTIKNIFELVRIGKAGDLNEALKEFITAGGNINVRDDGHDTFLHWAAFRGDTSIIDVISCYEPKLNIQDSEGYTPLHLAVSIGNEKVVDFLISLRARINISNKRGWMPLRTAQFLEDKEIIILLKQHGAK